VQQGRGALPITALKMVKCRRYLNQCLQESFLRLPRLQPYTFPILMCRKELSGTVASQALGKASAIPVESHHQVIIPKYSM